MTNHPRALRWPGCSNVRHLGGFPARGGQTQTWGLIRADNLARLTEAGRQSAAAQVSAILDLRSAWELDLERNPFDGALEGPLYLHRPLMNDADQEGMRLIETAPGLGQMYTVMLERFGQHIAAIFQAIADAPPGAVVIHCHAGKDRTGLVVALALELIDVDRLHIVEDYVLSDQYLAGLYAEMLSAALPEERETLRQRLTSHAEAIVAALGHLRAQHGGARAYLLAMGLSEETLERLERRLVAVG